MQGNTYSKTFNEVAFQGVLSRKTINPGFLERSSSLNQITFRTMAIQATPIKEIIEEGEGIKTFLFKRKLKAKPGQFLMLWLPEFGEKPFSISFLEKKYFGTTIAKKGEFTSALHSMHEGDLIGVRGPFGNGFSLKGKNILCVGGGSGVAPLHFLASEALKKKMSAEFVIGARTEKYLIFAEKLREKGIPVRIATEDGSNGERGTTVELLEKMDLSEVDCVYACGREEMLKKVAGICLEKGVKAQLSLENYKRCGFGLCNQNCLKQWNFKACKNGPVFNLKELRKVKGFFSEKQ
ncbi:MAG: dihydroorotate dehydrogenase electron transfer subunit [archaeon]